MRNHANYGPSSFKDYAMAQNKSGKLIVVDGTSSAGKTTIVNYVKPLLGDACMYIAVDDFINEVFLEQYVAPVSKEKFIKRIFHQYDKMYDYVRTIVSCGKSVVLDTVLVGLEGLDSEIYSLNKLRGLPTLFVLVYCPLPVLVARIKKRNHDAVSQKRPQDKRPLFLAVKQISEIFCASNIKSIDTLSRHDVLEACNEARRELGNNEAEFVAFKKYVLSHLSLDTKKSIFIAPRLHYNYILNSEESSPTENAHKLYEIVKRFIV